MRHRRNQGGFDPLPWIVGAIAAGAAYELYKLIMGSSSGGGGAAPTPVPNAATYNSATGVTTTPLSDGSTMFSGPGGGGVSF